MKKSIYTFLAGMATLVLFLNNSSGYGAINDEGVTGAPGDALTGVNPKTCQSCHSSGAFGPPTMSIQFFDSLGTTAVASYLPNKLYTVRLTINAASGTPAGYGFQMIDLKKSDNTNVKGFLSTANQTADVQLSKLSNGRQYAEQSTRITNKTINVKWRAPATSGNGSISFYAVGNAVNGDGGSGGDGVTTRNIEFPEGRASTNDIGENIHISLSNTLVTEGVTLQLKSEGAHLFQVRVSDLTGRSVLLDKWQVVDGENQKVLDLSLLSKGAYMVQIIENQSIVTKKIVKL